MRTTAEKSKSNSSETLSATVKKSAKKSGYN